MIQIIEPNLDIKKWAIDLVVNNMKVYNKTPFLRYAKSKSINNPENIFLINYVDSKEDDSKEGDNRKGDNRGGDIREGDNRESDNREGDNREGDSKEGDNELNTIKSNLSYNAFATIRIIHNVLYIYEIHVESKARNKGIGSDLIKFIKNHFTNVNQIILYVHKKNTRGIEFYKRNEFVINNKAKCDHKYHEMVFTKN